MLINMSFNTDEDILKELENIHYPSGPLHQIIHCYKARINRDDEVTTIYNLSETHSPELRQRAVVRYERILSEEGHSNKNFLNARDNLAPECSNVPIVNAVHRMLQQMLDMPKEWTVVQMTPLYDRQAYLNSCNGRYFTSNICISVFQCGQNDSKPFMVEAKAPVDVNNDCKPIELAQEMQSIINANKEGLTSLFKRKKFRSQQEKACYFLKRQNVEDKLEMMIKDMQGLWLKQWRCLLTGKYVDENVEKEVQTEIVNFCSSIIPDQELSYKTLYILCCLVKTNLQLKFMKSAVQYCFPQADTKTVSKIVMFIDKLTEQLAIKEKNTRKHPLILVLHDSLDAFPWEMMDVLLDESVTRVPSIHFLYCLFKEHQHDIQDGFKILKDYDKGSYVVNPDGDLKSMEVRMMSFFNYWTPEWTGTSGYYPEKEEFFELLTSSGIFTYSGHGSGSHLIQLERIQKAHVKAIVLLFGCGSTRIKRQGPQLEMFGNYHMYLIARCPCVVGMLFEVTDLDTDILSSAFMAYWIPSEAPVHWKYLDKTRWKKSTDEMEQFKVPLKSNEEKPWEPDLVRALNKAKKCAKYYITRAACVVRGLPVKIQQSETNSSC